MNFSIVLFLSMVLMILSICTSALPFTGLCDSCGRECRSACGTRGFRTCCLNYLKKRSTPTSKASEMKLELIMSPSELDQYYPSQGVLIQDASDENQMEVPLEKPGSEKFRVHALLNREN